MNTIRIFISDDHTIFREGLRVLLETAEDIKIIGEAGNGRAAVAEAKRLQPDVLLMDLAMPLLNGFEAARRIAREAPAIKVLILSSYRDDQHIREALAAGAIGYVTKETASQDLLRAIRETFKGNAFFSPWITRCLGKQSQAREFESESGSRTLTSRQAEILQLIAKGYSTKEMAFLLALSNKTVEKHRQSLMDRLDIHDIATLTRYAVSIGVIDPHGSPGSRADRSSPLAKPFPASVRQKAVLERWRENSRCAQP